jgi:CRP-like cAMP-binding protein
MGNHLQPLDVTVVAATPLFSGLSPSKLHALLEGAQARTYPEDHPLFNAGDIAERYFVIVTGAVRLFALMEDGSETIIEVLSAGSSFAEAAIFASGRYPVHAEAMAGSRIVSLRADTLLRMLRSEPRLGLTMLASLHRWQLRLMGELRQLKGQAPAQRLAWYILNLVDAAEGATTVHLPYRKVVIASRIGITPESLSRALGRLSQLGVSSRGETIQVGDIAALRQFCKM